MRGRFLILSITSLFFSSSAFSFWGEKTHTQLCNQWKNGKISSTELKKELGLYLPYNIDNGRAYSTLEVEFHCGRLLWGE